MRYVLIDRFLDLELNRRARAVKCVTKGEPFMRGRSDFPSALVLEALLQTGGVLVRASVGFRRMSVLGRVSKAAFPAHARAGDRIVLEVEAVLSRREGTLLEGVATVDGTVVGRAEFMIVFVPPEMAPPPDPERDRIRGLRRRALRIPSEDQ